MVKKTEHKNLEARNLDYTYMLDKLLSLKVNQVLQWEVCWDTANLYRLLLLCIILVPF